MYQIITYIQGPEQERTLFQRLMGKPECDLYHLNPQLYRGGVSSPLHNFGVFTLETPVGEISSADVLERRVNEAVKSQIGDPAKIGELWLGLEHVQFVVKRDSR